MNPNCEVKGGTQNIIALTIDHINGGGKKHERELKKKGIMLYDWLIKNNFPPEMEGQLQVLCNNCQAIKRVENGENIPNKKKK
jgi:RNA 3'-terminal phosphate cyclase